MLLTRCDNGVSRCWVVKLLDSISTPKHNQLTVGLKLINGTDKTIKTSIQSLLERKTKKQNIIFEYLNSTKILSILRAALLP